MCGMIEIIPCAAPRIGKSGDRLNDPVNRMRLPRRMAFSGLRR